MGRGSPAVFALVAVADVPGEDAMFVVSFDEARGIREPYSKLASSTFMASFLASSQSLSRNMLNNGKFLTSLWHRYCSVTVVVFHAGPVLLFQPAS